MIRLKHDCVCSRQRKLKVVALLGLAWIVFFVLTVHTKHATPTSEYAHAEETVLALPHLNFTLCAQSSDCWADEVCLQRIPLISLEDHSPGASAFDFSEARHKYDSAGRLANVCIHKTELQSGTNAPRTGDGWLKLKAFRRFKGLCSYKGKAGLPLRAFASARHGDGKQCVPAYGKTLQTDVLLDIPNVVLAVNGREGTTPTEIASLYLADGALGTDAQHFAKLNNLTTEIDWYHSSKGVRLYELPVETFTNKEGRGRPVMHQVQAGDTLKKVAFLYSVPEMAVQLWNAIEDPTTLSTGTSLVVLPENYLQRVTTPLLTNSRRDVTLQLLRLFSDATESLGVPWFVIGGTLLGIHRECETLGWDLDVDVGMYINDLSDEFMLALEARGFQLLWKHGAPEDGFEMQLARMFTCADTTDPHVDLCDCSAHRMNSVEDNWWGILLDVVS